MTPSTSLPHSPATDRAGERSRETAGRLRPRVIFDAVVASYLHSISQRHRATPQAPVAAGLEARAC
jgi:hypothetical protein